MPGCKRGHQKRGEVRPFAVFGAARQTADRLTGSRRAHMRSRAHCVVTCCGKPSVLWQNRRNRAVCPDIVVLHLDERGFVGAHGGLHCEGTSVKKENVGSHVGEKAVEQSESIYRGL